MREITEHAVNPCNDALKILAVDEPGHGGANHVYHVECRTDGVLIFKSIIEFQNGPIKECGVNGITHEVLLAIVIDRLKSFQAGPYACRANELALIKVEDALGLLKTRTIDRLARGVEGTHQK